MRKDLRRAVLGNPEGLADLEATFLGQLHELAHLPEESQPPPEGVWGLPPEMLRTLPGYGPDIGKNREEARKIMIEAGYGPDKRLAVKVSVRNTPPFRDPAVILIDQLREVYIDAELETVESATWFPKVYRKDYKIGLIPSPAD